jgi:hypothetical protein
VPASRAYLRFDGFSPRARDAPPLASSLTTRR